MNWHDELSDKQLALMKTNTAARGLEPEWMQDAFSKITNGSLQWYCAHAQTWVITISYNSEHAYRLCPDWQRPEKKKKTGEWRYCKVFTPDNSGEIWFRSEDGIHGGYLHEAVSRAGYGGIEYKEFPGEWHHPGLMARVEIDEAIPDVMGPFFPISHPATPVRVRFWREG